MRFWQRRPQPYKVKTTALYGITIQMIRSYISDGSDGCFLCMACGDVFQTFELACQHLRAMSDIHPHPYILAKANGTVIRPA